MHADRLTPLSEAIAAGRGLPEVIRAAGRALDASLMVADDVGAAIAVAARSPAEERALRAGGHGVLSYDLRRAERTVGHLRLRKPGRAAPPSPALVRVVRTLIAAEVERGGASERAVRAEEAAVAQALLAPGDAAPDAARARALGVDLDLGAAVVVVAAQHDARLLLQVRRAAGRRSLATPLEQARVAVIVPAADEAAVGDAAEAIRRRLLQREPGLRVAIGHSRRIADLADLHCASREAALAARLAGPDATVAFERTGAYRLLLRSGTAELRRFYEDTVAPVVAHDAEHGTGLLETLRAFLECDGSYARASQRTFTHRHTVRYRLAQVHRLTGHDVASTRGREHLGLGLKAMLVLDLQPPDAPPALSAAA
jgi:sugar diacid utilization regulator